MEERDISKIWHFDIEDLHVETVLDLGFWGIRSQLTTHIHAHSYYELMLCHAGAYDLELADGHRLTANREMAYLIPPETYHRTCGTPDAQKLAIRFCCTRLPVSGTVYNAFAAAMSQPTDIIPLPQPTELLRLTGSLQNALQKQGLAQGTYTRVLLQELMILLLRELCRSIPEQRSPEPLSEEATARRLRVDEYLFRHYAEPITQEDLAKEMHLSKRQLSRILQHLYNTSFRQRLIEIRLSNAARLLTVTELSGEEIATRVGYTSVSGFYEAFRKHYGVSVGKYRTRLFQ